MRDSDKRVQISLHFRTPEELKTYNELVKPLKDNNQLRQVITELLTLYNDKPAELEVLVNGGEVSIADARSEEFLNRVNRVENEFNMMSLFLESATDTVEALSPDNIMQTLETYHAFKDGAKEVDRTGNTIEQITSNQVDMEEVREETREDIRSIIREELGTSLRDIIREELSGVRQTQPVQPQPVQPQPVQPQSVQPQPNVKQTEVETIVEDFKKTEVIEQKPLEVEVTKQETKEVQPQLSLENLDFLSQAVSDSMDIDKNPSNNLETTDSEVEAQVEVSKETLDDTDYVIPKVEQVVVKTNKEDEQEGTSVLDSAAFNFLADAANESTTY